MDYDLCVIGGGINGVGIARDAAGRGLSVLLVEAQDLAAATSSASTKLVHGGLRYLEHYEFKLVRESLKERERLLKIAPHIIWPLQFILPHDDNLRPAWMIRLGLFLYDYLGGRKVLQKSKQLDFATDSLGDPLDDRYQNGFSYADCWVDDARLVVLNAVDARDRGATIMSRTACTYLAPTNDKKGWNVSLRDMVSGDQLSLTAGMVVNAAGPWVRAVLEASGLDFERGEEGKSYSAPDLRLVKGSHIVVRRLYDGDHSYILQQPDGRIVFTIPYEGRYTLIGTTDISFSGDPTNVRISPEEISYLCDAVNRSFEKKIGGSEVVWSYSGVRSLFDDGEENSSKVTRDYKLHLNDSMGPPILSVFGGKITTYRKLAEHAVDRLSTYFPTRNLVSWTGGVPLPGGEFAERSFDGFFQTVRDEYPAIPVEVLRRYARAYGARMRIILGDAGATPNDLGQHYGDGVYQAEMEYLLMYEFAYDLDDILWRRSKLGLHIQDTTRKKIADALPSLLAQINEAMTGQGEESLSEKEKKPAVQKGGKSKSAGDKKT